MKEKAIGRYTLPWFINKYGDEYGAELYQKRIENIKLYAKNPKTRTEHTCPHCNKIGKGPNMKRYHFDNCKLNKL